MTSIEEMGALLLICRRGVLRQDKSEPGIEYSPSEYRYESGRIVTLDPMMEFTYEGKDWA